MSYFRDKPFISYYSNLTGDTGVSGRIGVLVDGTGIQPQLGFYGAPPCYLAECGEHIGEGGGEPHLHGDPYGPKCLYYNSTKDYPNNTSHPPHIAFVYDGGFVYGRYFLST